MGLHPASPRSVAPGTEAPGTEGAITVGFAVDDEGQLGLAYFTDPDGNELYLAEARRG